MVRFSDLIGGRSADTAAVDHLLAASEPEERLESAEEILERLIAYTEAQRDAETGETEASTEVEPASIEPATAEVETETTRFADVADYMPVAPEEQSTIEFGEPIADDFLPQR
jgi:hypothetical protein